MQQSLADAEDAALVSVVVPTFRRPVPLKRALASVLAQTPPPGMTVEVVVVDNAPEAGARDQVAAIAAGAAFPIRYVSEPKPGVATARNRGVREARGALIAFLDDDEEALGGWLEAMVKTVSATGADAVFGPVEARAEGGGEIGPFARHFGRADMAADQADVTALSAYFGTNNSLFRKTRHLNDTAPFDESLNQCGGEDSLLLKRLRRDGGRFAWAAEARVIEWVPPRRMDWRYVRRRKFLSGQIRTFVHRMVEPPLWRGVVLWMAVGAAQAVLAGAAGLALTPFDAARARELRLTAWGGLGKVLWMRRFRPGLYGTGLVS